ncbi:hypothetical protein PGB90_001196 [Kerria lacca]
MCEDLFIGVLLHREKNLRSYIYIEYEAFLRSITYSRFNSGYLGHNLNMLNIH